MLNGSYASDGSYRDAAASSVLTAPAATEPAAGAPGTAKPVLPEPVAGEPVVRRAAPRIAGLATYDDETVYTQAQVLERLGLAGDEFAERIFARCGVQRRRLNLDPSFMARSLQDRTPQVERELLERAIGAVDALGVDPAQVGTVISASLYSLGVPTLAHRLIEHYEMDPTTDKYHVTGVGCASGVPLMRLAAQTLHASPAEGERRDRHTLVVAAESMSGILLAATPEDAKAKTVGSSIFGDGCAAAVLSHDARAEGPAILASQVHQVGGTLGAVQLEVDGPTSYLHLARELPEIAGAGLPGVVASFLERQGLERSQIDHWIVHPGGRRIIENVQSALGLTREQVATSWDALADHGNIGTPSILYVLRDTIERRKPAPGERGLMVTIGPGVTVALMLLGW
ncbi:MAG TPA: 3-oxoacyl-[acyl-carrier-protein] synthase III C-terminal domain-containing protein [Solirubrobacteraceae bacterium]|nr:3-oxoacyl-[acyl-carrier-protein] synthase III C-terminal domain-containing protein [Solirubrobacteraceae bacterium]